MASKQLNVRVSDGVRSKLSGLVDSYGSEGKVIAAAVDLLHAADTGEAEREAQAYLKKLCNLRFKVCSTLNWAFTPDSPEDTTVIERGIDELAGIVAGLSDALKGNTRSIAEIRSELGDEQERIARAKAAQAGVLAGSQTEGYTESIKQQGAEQRGVDHDEPYLRCDRCGREEQGDTKGRPSCRAVLPNKQRCVGRMLLNSEGCTQDDYSQL